MRIVDAEGRLLDTAKRAWDSGVVMDIGHGTGSFSFETAEAVTAAGRKPDVISTDLHQLSINGPAFDLPTTLSKFLHLGMSLREVVEAATSRPAAVLGLENEVGTLRPGSRADVALFRIYRGDFPLQDIAGNVRHADQLLRNTTTIVGGRALERLPEARRSALDGGADLAAVPASRSPRSSGSCASSDAPPTRWRLRPAKRRRARMLETSAFVFATDLAGEGVDTVLDNLERRGGLGGVMPAFAYHAARDVFPHNPAHRVVLQERGVVFFPPEPALYAAGPVQPSISALALERDVLGETCRAAAARDLAVHAWTVFLHADRAGDYPSCSPQNAFGDLYEGDFCPANPDARTYVRALAADVSRYEIETILRRVPPLPRPRARLSPRALPHLARPGYPLPARALLLRALPRGGAPPRRRRGTSARGRARGARARPHRRR